MTLAERLEFEGEELKKYLKEEKEETKRMVRDGEIPNVSADRVINQFLSYCFGILVCIAISFSLNWLVVFIGILPFPWLYNPLFALWFVLSIQYVFIPGLVDVKRVHHGLLLLVNARFKIGNFYPVIGEGWSWIPPYIMKKVDEDFKEEIMDIPTKAEDKGLEVPCLALQQKPGTDVDDTSASAHKAVLLVRIGIAFRRFNSFQSEQITESELSDGLRNRVDGTCRNIGTMVSDLGFMKHQRIIAQIIEAIVDRDARHYWGRNTLRVTLPKIRWMNDALNLAFERPNVEGYQRKAEEIELAHVRAQLDTMMTFLMNKYQGLDAGTALSIAQEMIMGERGKSTHVVIKAGTALERAAALAGGLATPKTPTI